VERGGERFILGPKGVSEVALRHGDLLVLGDIDSPVRLRVTLGSIEPGFAPENTVVATLSRVQAAALERRLPGDGGAVEALFSMVAAFNETREREGVLSRVAEAALETIPGAVDALVALPDTTGGLVVWAEAHRGGGVCRQPDRRVCERVLSGEAALLFGEHDAAAMPAATLVRQGVGSGIAAALLGEKGALGVLQVNCAPGRFELQEAHLHLVAVLAHHAAMALERADLIARLQQAEERLREENSWFRRRAQAEPAFVARSRSMLPVLEDLRRATLSDVTVLLLGETGTGKEVAARYLHQNSRRRDGLLVPVNCGALTETLLDSELFGHRKGAFTGATSDRKGVFEVATGGTVFLDEIGETSPAVQIRLLRVLEEGKIKMVGEAVERPVDVRIVAATNRDLGRLVEEERFRQDLYYRIRVFPIRLPPLRERPEDVEPLCRLFVARYANGMGKRVGEIDASMVDALRAYAFPGNVRELANEMERAVVRVEEGEALTAQHLSEEVLAARPCGERSEGAATLAEQLANVEREIIARTLDRHGGHRVSAARELGLTRQGLAKKLGRLGL
jgi:Nif-specific regulatory protein